MNSIKHLSVFERILWVISLVTIITSFCIAESCDILVLCASLIGVTALIFVSKGDVLGQILTVVFSVLYAIISLYSHYYGEMITYLGMTAPIAAMSVVSWIRHPYNEKEVKVSKLDKKKIAALCILTPLVTLLFYFILSALGTANILFSTLSVATSFSASALMFFRSVYYAIAYAANDIVIITLWSLAAVNDSSLVPMVICFVMFLANDIYGFFNWRKMAKRQNKKTAD